MNYYMFIFRILLSLILGFAIGLERQLTGHMAGIRINILICMGTCFFTLFPIMYGSDQVFRVGASIVSGVGFLCSGVIFKENGSVRGMNTAATLWCTAAIGVLASTDAYMLSIIATIILVLSNFVLRPLALKISPLNVSDEAETMYRISIICFENIELDIRQLLMDTDRYKNLFLNNLESGDVVGNRVEVIAEYCSVGKTKSGILEEIVNKSLAYPDVVSSGWEIIK